MTTRRYHVASDSENGTWTIRLEGSSRIRNRFTTQREALSVARTLGTVVLHGKDGRFRSVRR